MDNDDYRQIANIVAGFAEHLDADDALTVGHKHVFTNLIIEFDEARATGTCRYYGTAGASSNGCK